MANAPGGDEDDWVKQALADAVFGPSTKAPPTAESLDSSIEPEPSPAADASESSLLDPADETDAAPEAAVVVEPEATTEEPLVEESLVEESASEVEESVRGADEPVGDPAAESLAPDEGAAPPATASRLFERPNFDATNDPGVDEMLAAERTAVRDLDEFDERTRLRGAVEWLVVLGSAVIVALILRAFLFQAFFIPSESMESTLLVNDRILVNKLSYRFGDINRGEIVVFQRPDDQPGEFEDLIKRVIGLPGETIEARNNTIYINGQVLIEPYLTPGEVIGDFDPIEIPAGEYFVMGDNRDNSGDSRVFGTIAEDRLIGRAFFLFWPLDRIGSL